MNNNISNCISIKQKNKFVNSSECDFNNSQAVYIAIAKANGEIIIDKNSSISSNLLNQLIDLQESPKKGKTKFKKPQNSNKLGYIDPTVAGIDIGAQLIHVSIPDGNGGVFIKEFGSDTPELHKIADELKKSEVITAVMEATGVYWVPLYEILEERGFKAVLVDVKSVKNVPGRKSDVLDCQWIQTLYSSGLLRAAFRPPRDRVKLRQYVRQRLAVIKTRQRSLLHMEKSLQLMNVKLSTAVEDIAGISGMDIMRAILKGERDPAYLASLRNRGCKKSTEVFIAALTGNFQEEHVFALKLAMDQYDFSNKQLKECDARILAELEVLPTITEAPIPRRDKDKKKNGKYEAARKPPKNELSFDARTLLWKKSGIDITALSGVGDLTALLVFAELGGTNVSCWNSSKEFCSWLKLCPGNNISGGKRRKSQKQPCSNYISQAFRMSALSAKNSQSAVGAHIRRICGRKEKPKGIKAGAHKIASQFYHMCKHGWQFHEKGADWYEKQHAERVLKNLKKKAKDLGFDLVEKAA